MKKRSGLFLLLLTVLVGISFVTIQWVQRVQPLPVYAGHTETDFQLLNQQGDTITNAALQGKIWVVNSFFTACPSICPAMMRNLKVIEAAYSLDTSVQLLSFTVDPKRDTPTRLAGFAAAYSIEAANWHLLTGDKLFIYKTLRKGFLLGATDNGQDTDFIHSENVVLLDRKRRIRGFYKGTDANAVWQLKTDIQKLKRESYEK